MKGDENQIKFNSCETNVGHVNFEIVNLKSEWNSTEWIRLECSNGTNGNGAAAAGMARRCV